MMSKETPTFGYHSNDRKFIEALNIWCLGEAHQSSDEHSTKHDIKHGKKPSFLLTKT
jgi:hypothetical protein